MREIMINLITDLSEREKSLNERVFYNDLNSVKVVVNTNDNLSELHVIVNSKKIYLDFRLQPISNKKFEFTFPNVAIKTSEKISILFEGFMENQIINYGTYEMGVSRYVK